MRLKCNPTIGSLDEQFVGKWNQVLSDASSKLMTLIVEHCNDTVTKLNEDIDTLKTNITNKAPAKQQGIISYVETLTEQKKLKLNAKKTEKFVKHTSEPERRNVPTSSIDNANGGRAQQIAVNGPPSDLREVLTRQRNQRPQNQNTRQSGHAKTQRRFQKPNQQRRNGTQKNEQQPTSGAAEVNQQKTRQVNNMDPFQLLQQRLLEVVEALGALGK